MKADFGRRAAVMAAAVAAVAVVGGCGGSHRATQNAGAVTPATSSQTATSSTVSHLGSTAGNRASTTSVAAHGGPSTLAHTATLGATTTVARAAAPSSMPPPPPAQAGTYVELQSGTASVAGQSSSEPPRGTLVVQPPQSSGFQLWQRYVRSSQPANTEVQFRANGPVILSTTEQVGQGSVNCVFAPPIPAPPWPTTAGQTFSAVGKCGTLFTITVSGRVVGSRAVKLADGTSLTVWVIDSSLTASGQITATGTQVDWYSPTLRLPVHEEVQLGGSYSIFAFSIHSLSDLASSRPS